MRLVASHRAQTAKDDGQNQARAKTPPEVEHGLGDPLVGKVLKQVGDESQRGVGGKSGPAGKLGLDCDGGRQARDSPGESASASES